MSQPRIASLRLTDVVASRLEERILEGSLKPGDKLPSERDLAAEFGISRPSVREAIQKLASKELVTVRHGGGTFVTDRLIAALADPWEEMLTEHPLLRSDLLEFRHMLEAKAAALAAERATAMDIERMDAALDDLERAYGTDNQTVIVAADVSFHQVVAEAAHNVLVGHMTSSLLRLIRKDMTSNIAHLHTRPKLWEQLLLQHRAIWEAVRNRKPEAAMHAAGDHVDFVRQNMAETDLNEQRTLSAQRRLDAPSRTKRE